MASYLADSLENDPDLARLVAVLKTSPELPKPIRQAIRPLVRAILALIQTATQAGTGDSQSTPEAEANQNPEPPAGGGAVDTGQPARG